MTEGISGIVNIIDSKIHDKVAFKEFKAPYEKNKSTYLDYNNEVATLKMLSSYEQDLPFQVSTIFDCDLYDERGGDNEPIGFIAMSALNSTLKGSDLSSKASEVYKKQAFEAGRSAAQLHEIKLSSKDIQVLKRDPVDVKVDFLLNHPMAENNKELIADIVQKLRSMSGEKVFVHNDFHASNLFVGSSMGEIEAACDFCYAGMGVRELDFSFYTNYRDDFVSGYEQISPNKLNSRNLDVMKAMELVFKKLNTELELKKALESMK